MNGLQFEQDQAFAAALDREDELARFPGT